jgi:hypothetical protein
MKPQNDYDRGFGDALKFVAQCLRSAASAVETPTYADFERKSGVGNAGGAIFRGVARTGQLHFATQLRAVAAELETLTKGTPDGSQT